MTFFALSFALASIGPGNIASIALMAPIQSVAEKAGGRCWPALVLILLTDRGDGFVDESTSERD